MTTTWPLGKDRMNHLWRAESTEQFNLVWAPPQKKNLFNRHLPAFAGVLELVGVCEGWRAIAFGPPTWAESNEEGVASDLLGEPLLEEAGDEDSSKYIIFWLNLSSSDQKNSKQCEMENLLRKKKTF